jgi:putative peptidoglycan lipid II flippase
MQSEKMSATGLVPADLQSESLTTPNVNWNSLPPANQWGVGSFRFHFNPAKFRPGRDFTGRRFSIAEAALLLIMAYLASRGLGVVRQGIFNALFGTGPVANAYIAAFRLPDMLFNLIAGGALIQAFVPVFVSYGSEHGQRETWRLTSLVFNVLLVALTALVLIGEFTAPAFVDHWLVPGYSPSEQALTTALTRIMLFHPLILGIGTIATAVLSSKRQFLLPALSIAIYNLGLIGGLLVTLAIPAVGIYGPTYGVLAGAICQVLVQLPGLLKQGFNYSFVWDLRHPGLRQVMLLLAPNLLAVGISSIALIVDTAFTSYLPDKSSLSAIHNAHMLFDLPVALLGQTLALAALPRMSALAVAGQRSQLRQLVLKVVGGAVLISLPTAVLLVILGRPAIHILFQHGAFTSHSSALTSLALIGYAIGLSGRIATELLKGSFYALKNALVPLLTDILAFALRVGFLLFLLKILTGKYVILAIPLAAGGAATVEAGLLCLLIHLRLRRDVQRKEYQARLDTVAAPKVEVGGLCGGENDSETESVQVSE